MKNTIKQKDKNIKSSTGEYNNILYKYNEYITRIEKKINSIGINCNVMTKYDNTNNKSTRKYVMDMKNNYKSKIHNHTNTSTKLNRIRSKCKHSNIPSKKRMLSVEYTNPTYTNINHKNRHGMCVNYSMFLLLQLFTIFSFFKPIHSNAMPILQHNSDTTFTLHIPSSISPKTSFLYNNTLNKINGEERRVFPIFDFEPDEVTITPLTFTVERLLSPNLYYGIEIVDYKNRSFFSNRFYYARNGVFYDDKSKSPDRDIPEPYVEDEKKPLSWMLIPLFIISVAILSSVALGVIYGIQIYFKKLKKERMNKNQSKRPTVLE